LSLARLFYGIIEKETQTKVDLLVSNGEIQLFRKGEVIKTVPEAELVDTLFREIDQYLESLDEESLC